MRKHFLAAAACAAAATACSTPTPPALVDARSSYEDAQADPTIGRYGSVQMYEAKQALDRAESEWTANGDVEETEHLAGLASKKVDIARSTASGQAAVARAQSTLRQKDAVLLDARTREVVQAKREADQAKKAAAAAAEAQRQLQEEIARMQLEQTERGLLMTLGDVLFDFDQATLRPGAANKLVMLGDFLKKYPDRQLLIEGYTDSVGSDGYNLGLSQRRAEAVRDFLVANGVPETRLVATGYGKAYPKDSNSTSSGRQANRRVEATILDPGVLAVAAGRSATPPVGAQP
jgi:outer membrane protein OmpA-like peptidoglycan-associated protein